MVVNHQGEQSRHLHPLLEAKLSKNIILYKQDGHQPDVWQTLAGEKDDFFIYDRFDMKQKIQLHLNQWNIVILDNIARLHRPNLTMLFCPFPNRCGRLTHRISLPYSIIGEGHIEKAIKDTYCKRLCGDCTHEV